ncbi:hypothetical protein [Nakamurella sp. PAMC28650]|uniref:hypothetical protein n=1 Tax=Nakamurella sp. PAMC28650 TaxID=2762325 RepID=UPI00164E9FA6|nr:hypothetical protein [Nakamurella sp. PAMC28650]QNK82890.1 hypothetical protein H7F38_09585 [Nakamurella sp. PAMC28650]
MATQIVGLTATQVAPIKADAATVHVAFQVAGDAPDTIQIYAHDLAGGDVGGLADLRQTVAFVAGTANYEVNLALRAGTAFTVSVCPRMNTDKVDGTIDGQPWSNYCVVASLFTRTPTSPAGQAWPPPVITGVDPEPATLAGDATITVSWQSAVPYDKFLIWWTESGIANAQGEVESQGTSGSWSAGPTRPGLRYTFAVMGGVSAFWDYKYSTWGPTVPAVGVANLHRLREFLVHSGRPAGAQSVRSLLPRGGSLRALMRI